MRIVDVTLAILPWADGPAMGGARSSRPPSDLGYLRIVTDEGVEGNSFLGSLDNPASADAHQLIRRLKPMLVGQDPLERERLYQEMRPMTRLVSYRVVGAVDVALWDLAGKVAGLPIHQLLGSYRSSIPAYASSQRFEEAGRYAEQALDLQQRGWRGFKIHPPKRPRLDIEIVRAVREAVGDEYLLMLDGGWSYSYADALRVGRVLGQEGYLWFEDPLGDEDIYNYVKLRQKLDLPILATEFPQGGLDSYPIWITERATDMLRGDVPTKGGITPMVKTAHLAEAFNMPYEIHYSANALGEVANLHVAMAIRNCQLFEMLYPDPVHSYGLVHELAIDEDGLLHAPMAPGLGVEVDLDLISSRTESVLS